MMNDVIYVILTLVIVMFSIILHEIAHGYVAYLLGDDTAKNSGRLTLNPLKHIDPFLTIILPVFLALSGGPVFGGAKPVPFNAKNLKWDEWGVALVALAGPFINLIIAFVAFGIDYFLGTNQMLLGQILNTTVYVNVGLFVFNLIPIPPLDGSRLLYALAPDFVRDIMIKIEPFSIFIVLALLFIANSAFFRLISAMINYVLLGFQYIFSL